MSPYCCPKCRGELLEGAPQLVCNGCGATYPNHEWGVDFRPEANDSNKDAQADIYDGMLGELSDYRYPHNLTLAHQRALLEALPLRNGARVLEIGGHRSGVLPFLEHIRSIQGLGLDISREWVAEQNRLSGLRGRGTIWAQGDAERLPFPDNSIDAVVTFDVFEHLSDMPKAAKECFRVLKPRGTLLCHMPIQDVGGSLDGIQRRFDGEGWRARQASVGHYHDRMPTGKQASKMFGDIGFELADHQRFNVWIQPFHDHKWLTWLGQRRHRGKTTHERAVNHKAAPSSGTGASRFQKAYSRIALPLVRVLAAPDRLGARAGIGGSASWTLRKPGI